MARKRRTNEERIEAAILYYAPLLKLSDWDIRYAVVQSGDMDGDRLAEVECCPQRRSAIITVKDPDVWPDGEDLDFIVVHELVHVVLWASWNAVDTDEKQILEEQAVNALAHAIRFGRKAVA